MTAATPSVRKTDQKRGKGLTPDDAQALLAALTGQPLENVVTVALATGLREGELAGLTWEDVDLDQHVLHVRYQLQQVNGKLCRVEPKTDSGHRTITREHLSVLVGISHHLSKGKKKHLQDACRCF